MVKYIIGDDMQKILVFGHKNPDTDSVASSIALSYLKNKEGYNTEPRVLGSINNETRFILNYFNVSEPKYLNDVKVRIKDVKYEKNFYIHENKTIHEAYKLMNIKNTTAIPLVNDNNKLTGYVTLKELTKYLVSPDKEVISTTLKNIVKTLKAEIVTSFNDEIAGKINIVGVQSETLILEDKVKTNDILITGDRYRVIERAIDHGASLIILTNNASVDSYLVERAKLNKINIIRTIYNDFVVANKISLSNYIKLLNSGDTPITVLDEDYYTDFKQRIHKVNHTNYPVVNKKGICSGLLRLTGINKYRKRKVMLVDHNSFRESVDGLEEADILEIIDHHQLSSVSINRPINFRSLPVGCTATIIYTMFKEKNIEIPREIAGLLLSAIISDTLLFSSPTTTKKDQRVADDLAKIINIDTFEFGREVLRAASSIEGMSTRDLVYNDYKSYSVNNKKVGISIVNTMDFQQMEDKVNEINEFINNKAYDDYVLWVMFITDPMKNGSYIIYSSNGEEIIKNAFALDNVHQGIFIPRLVSRKKQMLPAIIDVIEASS